MKNTLTVAILQSPGSLLGPQSRVEWLHNAINSLDTSELDLLVLPELFLTGYHIGDNVQQWAEKRDGLFSRQIAELSRLNQLAIVFGYAEQDGKQIFNSAACYDKAGVMVGHHRKLVLPPGFELNHFTPGGGYSQFEVGGFTIAILICYDAEFPETVRDVSIAGCDLVVVPTALGEQWGIVSSRLIPTRAFENGVFVCYANHSGQENGLSYYGGSCIVGPDGSDLARTDHNEGCVIARLDVAAVKAARARLPYHIDRLKLPDAAP